MRSGHRDALTRDLAPVVSSFVGVGLDIGGGRDSILAPSWTAAAYRIRLDIITRAGPCVQGDALSLPVRSGSVDCVLLSEVLEHLYDPATAVAEAARVLRPGGTIAGSVPFLCQGVHADPHDYYRYTESALRRLLAGFEEVDVRPHGNGLGVAWRMLFSEVRVLAPLNPLMRLLSRRSSSVNPEGYVFVARRPLS